MGDPRKKTFEEEALDALNGGGSAGSSFEEEAQQALAAKDDPPDVAPRAGGAAVYSEPDPSLTVQAPKTMDDYMQALAQEGADDLQRLMRTGVSLYLGGPIGSGPIAASLGRAFGGGATSLMDSMQEGKDVWQALLDAGKEAGKAVAFGKVADLGGWAAGGAKDIFRTRQLGPTTEAVKNLEAKYGSDYVPANLGKVADELGLTNYILPQSVASLRDRAAQAASAFGKQQDAALAARDAEIAAQLPPGVKQDWGQQIAGDMFNRANAAAVGPLGDAEARAAAMAAVGRGAARSGADDLQKLRQLKTTYENQRYEGATGGTDESRMGTGHGLAADEARQYLDNAMSGAQQDGIYRDFVNAKEGFSQAKTVEELAREQNARILSGNASGGGMGAAARGMIGQALGGPVGAAAGVLAGGRMNDYLLSGAGNVSRAVAGTSNMLGQGAGAVVNEYDGRQRGYLLSQAVEMVLDRNPEALGPYAQVFLEAKKNDTLEGTLYRLQMHDDTWRQQYLPQLQSLTIEP